VCQIKFELKGKLYYWFTIAEE